MIPFLMLMLTIFVPLHKNSIAGILIIRTLLTSLYPDTIIVSHYSACCYVFLGIHPFTTSSYAGLSHSQEAVFVRVFL